MMSPLTLLRKLLLHVLGDHTAPIPPAVLGTIRVACIGDSITYGTTLLKRGQQCYPAQLQALLGAGYSVRNFGVSGRTLQRSGDLPYWEHKNFKLSSVFDPHIALIMLGTNDSKKPNWKGLEAFLQDTMDLTRHYQALPSHPTIFLLTPPREFMIGKLNLVNYGMSNAIIDEITAALKTLADKADLKVIDINAATAHHPEYFRLDGIHPDAHGASLIAGTVHQALLERLPGG
jgi:acyl-CoA thioesterase I